MKKNDKVILNVPVKEEYRDTMIPAGTELMIWKASRDGTLRCSYKGRYGAQSVTVKATAVTPILGRNCPMPQKGDLFVSSWGYGQTNIDYFQVVGVKGKMIEVCRIQGANLSYDARCFQGTTKPVPNAFTSEARRYLVRFNAEDKPYFKVASYANAYPTTADAVHNYSDGN